MFIIAAVSSCFAYCLFITVLSPWLENYEAVDKRVKKLEAGGKDGEELNKPFAERVIAPLFSKLLKNAAHVTGRRNSETLEKELRLAGVYMPAGEFSALELMFALIFACVGAATFFVPEIKVALKLLCILFALILGILAPRFYLKSRTKKRQNEIKKQMPEIMDLLSVSVEAGLGFDAALLRVSGHSSGALIDELMSVYREVQMGKSRKEAFKSLGDRSTVEELKTFAGAIVQAEQLGISIKNVLKLQAQQLRLKRRQAAEEKAMKAPIKMMLPLVIFIFPVIFIILLGPSAIKIIQILG